MHRAENHHFADGATVDVSLGDDLKSEVHKIFRERWASRPGRVVPDADDVKLGNDAVELKGTVLYADLEDSTKLVDSMAPWFAAEIYKSYLACAARVIRSQNGVITGYDGDRVMAVYLGKDKDDRAVRSALKINYAVQQIVNPAIKVNYPDASYSVQQVVGVDSSSLFVARTGIRGSNDLVWVGTAANHAAKLCAGQSGQPARITGQVYDALSSACRYGGNPKRSMWVQAVAPELGRRTVYESSWHWKV